MNRIAILSLLLTILLPSSSFAEQRKLIIAIFNVEARGVTFSDGMILRLTDYLSARLAEKGHHQVIPRDQIRSRLAQKKQDSYKECFDQSCQIEIGKELAAEKSLATQIIRLGSKCMVTSTVYDLRRATTEVAATASGGCTEDGIVSSLQTVVEKLAPSSSERAVPPPPLLPPAAVEAPPPTAVEAPEPAVVETKKPEQPQPTVVKTHEPRREQLGEPLAPEVRDVGFSGWALWSVCLKGGYGGGVAFYCDDGISKGLQLFPVTYSDANLFGVQFGLASFAFENLKGWQFGAMGLVANDLRGMQLAALAITKGNMRGLHWSGIGIVGKEAKGHMAAWGFSYTRDLKGLITNFGISIVGRVMSGLQATFGGNYAGTVRGVQAGGINLADTVRGLQIGAINYTNNLVGVQIGAINIAAKQTIPFMPALLVGW